MAKKPGTDVRQPIQNELRQDPLVERLRPAPSDPEPDVIRMRGFLGRDVTDGFWRIYVEQDLTSYFRIPEKDILGAQSPDDVGDALEPKVILVRANTSAEWVTSVTLDKRMSFLQGQYTASLSETLNVALMQAVVSQHRRPRTRSGSSGTDLQRPATPGFPCRPQITIENPSCFCSVLQTCTPDGT